MRNLSSEMTAVSTAEVVRPILLVECDFDSGDVNLWNGVGSLDYGGKSYIGAGNLLAISTVGESVDMTADGLSVSLSGLNNSLLTLAKDEDYQGRKLIAKLGAMDENNDVVSSPVVIFTGFMDTMTINEAGDASSINLTVENKLIQLERARVRRFTDNDQKIDYPNDEGFSFVTKIQDKEIVWGRSSGASGSGGRGVDIMDDRRMR